MCATFIELLLNILSVMWSCISGLVFRKCMRMLHMRVSSPWHVCKFLSAYSWITAILSTIFGAGSYFVYTEGCVTLEVHEASQNEDAYLTHTIDLLRRKIDRMPQHSRFLLLVPADLFFNPQLYGFMLAHALPPDHRDHHGKDRSSKYVAKGKATPRCNDMLSEMRVHADFMRVFVEYYIRPTYRETAAMVTARSAFFFQHHQSEYDNVRRGMFLTTCVQGSCAHAHIHEQLLLGSDCDPFGGASDGDPLQPARQRSVPPVVKPTIDKLLFLVRMAKTHLACFLQDCTRQRQYAGARVSQDMMPMPRQMHVKSLSLRHILHEIVFVINENLCGRFRKALQAHAYYTQSILQTKPLLHKHVQLLIFVLDNIETKIDHPLARPNMASPLNTPAFF